MYFRDPSTESTNAELFFAPLPQHTDSPSPESFEQEFTRLDLHLPFEQYDNFLPAFHDSIPDISPPSAYPNHSGHKVTSHHSSDFTQSDHSIPSDSLLNNGFYGTIHSPDFSNGLPPIQPLHTAGAQFGFETSNLGLNVGISPGDLSTAVQVPAAAAAHMTPNSEIQMQIGPGPDRPYQCPICPHSKLALRAFSNAIQFSWLFCEI